MGNKKGKGYQSKKKQGYYTQQFRRTASNKIRRLTKRMSFDPTAEAAIKTLRSI